MLTDPCHPEPVEGHPEPVEGHPVEGFSARVLTDSVSPAGVRLTTLEVRFPRFILSEFNTHRTFCLSGDTKLYFDLPEGAKQNKTRRFTMTLRELHEKWHQGAAPSLSAIYSARELAPLLGFSGYTGVDLLTRRVGIPRIAIPGQPYRVRGLDLAHWINTPKDRINRQPIRERLAAMNLRSCNEQTGEIYHTRINDVCYSGHKDVFRVVLEDGRTIDSSKDHLFLTRNGWQRLEDAVGLELTPGGIATWTRFPQFAMNGTPAKKKSRHRQFAGLSRIEYLGKQDTYDIEVTGPYHNFVANGFIVHNSRNSASSRAVPTNKMIERVLQNPAMPVEWGVNKPGMSASERIAPEQEAEARAEWLRARDSAVQHVRRLQQFNIHKQIVNRLLEPFMWHTVIITATEWDNFYKLRLAENAQPEIRVAARLMHDAMNASHPSRVDAGRWHLPLVQNDERTLPIETQKMISAARCARVSYLTHDGKRDIDKDIELCERLRADRHLSPFEHVATPLESAGYDANFRGWMQMRKEIEKTTL